MPHLAQGDTCRVTRSSPNIEIHLYTIGGGPAALRVCSPDESVNPVIHERRQGVLTTYSGCLEIRAIPPRGRRLPRGTVVQFEVVIGTERWLGPEVDVSELPEVTLGTLSPASEGPEATEIRALKIDEITASEQLTEVTSASQYEARALAHEGLAQRVPAGLALCLDSSASMGPYSRSGLLQILVEIALGVDRGLGDACGVPVVAVDVESTRLADLTVETAGDYVNRYFGGRCNITGLDFRSSLPQSPFGEAECLVVLVTDAWNAELESCVLALAAKSGQLWRPLLLGPQLILPRGLGFGQLSGSDLELSVGELTTDAGQPGSLGRVIRQMVGTIGRKGQR